MTNLTPSDLLTVSGAGVVVALVVEIVKRAGGWTPATVDRFGPLAAAIFGVLLVTATGWYEHADLVQSALTGLLAGATAMGISDAAGTVNAPSNSASSGHVPPPVG